MRGGCSPQPRLPASSCRSAPCARPPFAPVFGLVVRTARPAQRVDGASPESRKSNQKTAFRARLAAFRWEKALEALEPGSEPPPQVNSGYTATRRGAEDLKQRAVGTRARPLGGMGVRRLPGPAKAALSLPIAPPPLANPPGPPYNRRFDPPGRVVHRCWQDGKRGR